MKRTTFALPLFLTAALLGAITPLANGQETNAPLPAPSLSLDALVAEALERNPELKFYEAELKAARAGQKSAGQWRNPELTGSVGQKTVRGGGLRDEGIAWSATLLQPFEWPGRIGLRKAIANRDVELAQLGFAQFQAALTARVRLLGFGLFAAQEKASAAREVAERFRELREVLVQRDPAGLTPLLETRVIEATELTAQRTASTAELAAKSALLELNQLRGAAPGDRLVVTAKPPVFGASPEAPTLLAAARTNNFELRLRAVELTQQGFRVDLARNERYPTLAIGPTFTEEKAGGEREHIAGIGISLPLPLWNRNSANVETAKARQTQAEVSLLVQRREVESQILQAAHTYEASRRAMRKWRPDAVQHFKEAAELADRHYRLGAVPVATYVELQKQYLEAVESLLDTKKDALAAANQIELLTGLPVPLAATAMKEVKP